MKKVILSLGISLDGYIAKKNGDVSWMDAGSSDNPGEDIQASIEDTINEIGVIIMGRAAYDVTSGFGNVKESLGKSKKIVVLTSREINDEGIETYSGNVKDLVDREKESIWLFGGTNVVTQFLKENLVTHIELGIVPVLLGDGIPLWEKTNLESSWNLDGVKQTGQVVLLNYSKK